MKFITFSATRIPLIFTISLVIIIGFRNAFADSMYGEDDTYLGNIVDSYLNDNNVNASVDVINNVTLGCMELVYGEVEGMILENFTLYIEVDEADGITVVSPIYVIYASDRSRLRYLYYDFGIDGLHNYKLYGYFRQDYHNSDAWTAFSMMSNFIGDEKQHRNNVEDHTFFNIGGSAGNLNLYEYDSGNFYSAVSKTMVDDTDFWFKLEKNGLSFELDIYTTQVLRDAEGNGDWYDQQLTLHNDYSFRYYYLIASYDTGIVRQARYLMYDHWFNGTIEAYEEDGYYTTIDMLDGDRALNLLYNASIVTDTNIKMEFLNGSGKWVNHNNVLGFESLVNGFESIDLRDVNSSTIIVRVNMTTTDSSLTPRMYQLRYVTIIGEVEVGEGGINSASIIMAIFLIIVGISLIYSVRRKR